MPDMTPENKQLLQAISECAKKAKDVTTLIHNSSCDEGCCEERIEYIDARVFIQELEKLLIEN